MLLRSTVFIKQSASNVFEVWHGKKMEETFTTLLAVHDFCRVRGLKINWKKSEIKQEDFEIY